MAPWFEEMRGWRRRWSEVVAEEVERKIVVVSSVFCSGFGYGDGGGTRG